MIQYQQHQYNISCCMAVQGVINKIRAVFFIVLEDFSVGDKIVHRRQVEH